MAPAAQSRLADAYAHCAALVRAADRDAYLAGLFAPAAARPHLHALHAFAGEIARVRFAVREPLAGEIRLQWWRDLLAGEGRGEVAAHPVAAALLDTIARCALPPAPLTALIDARACDLYDDAMASVADLDAYAQHVCGALFALSAHILGGSDGARASLPAAAPAGIASLVTQRLAAFPRDLAQRQFHVPLDLLARHGATRGDAEAGANTAALRAALADLRGHARAAFAAFAAAAPSVPGPCAPAFLPVTVVRVVLHRLDAAAGDPFAQVAVPAWRRQLALWRAARRWPKVRT